MRHAIKTLWLALTAFAIVLLLSPRPHVKIKPSLQPSPTPPPPPPSPPPTTPFILDIVVAADTPLFPGVAGLVRSARASSEYPESLQFHWITLKADMDAARDSLRCYGLDTFVRLIALPPELLASRIRVSADPAVTGKLASPLNFVRFYLPQLLPSSVERVLYLDADIIVKADVHALFEPSLLPPPYALAAVPRPEAHFRYSRYAKKCAALFAARHNGRETLNVSAQTFNAGVALIDLRRWRAANLTSEAAWWMDQHKKASGTTGLWALGSQPVMHLIMHGRWAPLPPSWNFDGLGRVPNLQKAAMESAKLLHWTGRKKPWLGDGLHQSAFTRHVGRAEVKSCCYRIHKRAQDAAANC